ncbi:hypothetical protein N7509_002786 [Penicillium cosmopolitanum]|uniref:Uncharacterized protein n=1 Tax=Penicillium cosmopolitanum TaxID=1131564 RepID=A0A9W9W9P6_9EURO|nr:uncharacterized protein N7509_002786 [Penicillium cosmopolitanum]KAJ5408903.1 hypothetical protein N7509_002786 [Penicillium cosmopolitanum]
MSSKRGTPPNLIPTPPRHLGGPRKRGRALDSPSQSKRQKIEEGLKRPSKPKAKQETRKILPLANPHRVRETTQIRSNSVKAESKSPPRIGYSTSSRRTAASDSSEHSSGSQDEDGNRKKKHNEDDDPYRDYGSPDDDFEIEAQFDKEHAKSQAGVERRNLVNEITQEKARRMAKAVRVPTNSKMGDGERNLYLELALRGCKPVMYHHWKTDFSTLPESLFSSEEPRANELEEIIFKTKTRSEFHAIKAMKELLDLGGQVRDCGILTAVYPPEVIRKVIAKYIRWAIDDAGLQTNSDTLPFHIIYAQQLGQPTVETVTKVVKKLTKLALQHRSAYEGIKDVYWPTLVGYVICGPIATILSLDSNPSSPAWGGAVDKRVKYMGQFDLTEPDQDVWNSLALAISVIHVRETMLKLAATYSGPRAPFFRGQNSDFSDDD